MRFRRNRASLLRVLAACFPALAPFSTVDGGDVKIQWFGQSYFVFEDSAGIRIAVDPFGQIGYALPEVVADAVLITHEHADHNNQEAVRGARLVLRSEKGVGDSTLDGIKIRGLAAFHDDQQGKNLGKNTVYVFEMDGLRICHMGDIGHFLSRESLEAIGRVDILCVPVGGKFTLDPKKVDELVDSMAPRVVLPMHYKTPKIKFPLAGPEVYLEGKSAVKRLKREVRVAAAALPEKREIWILAYD